MARGGAVKGGEAMGEGGWLVDVRSRERIGRGGDRSSERKDGHAADGVLRRGGTSEAGGEPMARARRRGEVEANVHEEDSSVGHVAGVAHAVNSGKSL
jgi:hypothetical protein